MDEALMRRYPSVDDLIRRARRRIPHFAWEFVDSGTGADACVGRNRQALDEVTLVPRFMRGSFEPQIATTIFGTRYEAPFGVAPVGMSGVIWPQTEEVLARTAARYRIPFTMSTAGNAEPETLARLADGMGWFQLYPPRSANMRRDLLTRARDAGFTTLLVTADVPVMSRRERQTRAGVSARPEITLRLLYDCARHPAWTLATLRHGQPRIRGLERYADTDDMNQFLAFVGRELNGTLDWDYLKGVRDEWDGPVVLKGVLSVEQAEEAVAAGVDGIQVSNHGGRQLDAAPAAITVLPAIAAAVGGRATVLFDSGVRSGLDVARALALGADFVLLGRAFMLGVAALGEAGGDHTADILVDELRNVMSQLGCAGLPELRERLASGGS